MRATQTPSGRDPAQLTADPGAKLRLETQILYELLPTAQWVHLAAIMVVFGLLLNHVEFGALLDWLGLMLLILCLRVLISMRYDRVPKPLERPQYWFNLFLVGTLLYGVMWSGTAILLVPVERAEVAVFTALLLCGLAAGAVAVSSVNLEVFLVYAASTMWPYAGLLIATQHDVQALTGWLVLLFFVVISITAMRVNGFFTRLVDLQLRTHFLEREVRHESRKRELAERALLENTLEEELAEMIRKQTALLHDTAPTAAGDARPATADEVNAVRGYLRRLNELLSSQVQSAEKFVGLVLESNLSKDQRQYMSVVEKILHNAGLVLKRIDPAVTVADIEAGIERRRFNLWRALTYLTHELPLAQKAKFVTLRRKVEKNVPQFVIGDDGKLTEVLQHLVRNAVESSDGGTVTIAVEKGDEDDTSVEIDFKVIDTGVGMRREVLTALQESERGPDLDPRGGLAAARALVQLLGGSLYASSQTGAGTTVGFRLRFGKDKESLVV
jgi:signal transduction histidine kinase